MQFKTLSIIASLAAAAFASTSSEYSLMNTRSASKFHFTDWAFDVEGEVIIAGISNSTSLPIHLSVESDSTVKIEDGRYFQVGDDFAISLTTDPEKATSGFAIGAVEGSLTPFSYQGSNSYIACANADGDYLLYTENPSFYSDDTCAGVSTWAT